MDPFKISDETCGSMYLSFDSNSTISNAASASAYKTLEASGLNETGFLDVSIESHLNSTLESQTVKKIEQQPSVTSPRPLKVFNQNILQYKAVASTPTKLTRDKKVSDSSAADLGVLVDEQEVQRNSYFQEENKENANADSEISNLSSSVEIITSQMSVLHTEKDSLHDAKNNSKVEKMEVCDAQDANLGKKMEIVQNKNYRKSVCEPNLNTNRPSRIATSNKKRTSLIPSARSSEQQKVPDIPKLLNKMLKISNMVQKDEFNEVGLNKATITIDKQRVPTAVEKKLNSLLPPQTSGGRGRSSLMQHAEKRPFSFTRMSIVVKTTLNSPARKIARKSISSGQVSGIKPRRSVLPAPAISRLSVAPVASTSAISSLEQIRRNKNSDMNNRQSLLTTSSKSKLTTVFEKETKTRQTTVQLKTALGKKSDSMYTCSVCSRQFRVKSLLDAHKRSHEEDFTITTAVVKKHTTAAASESHSSASSSTQCKYCDKKFAIVRALHIHLMQNCLKIPPNEKRKLEFTEMNHVEKAQLPELFSNAIQTTASKKLIKTNSNISSTSSTQSFLENKDKATETAPIKMAPPSQAKLRKKAAHSGVYRTPSKNVSCYICKQSFKNILDYTNHSMAVHSSAPREVKIQIPDSTN